MLWWLIILSVLVLYLFIKLYQLAAWLKLYFDAVNQHFIDCGCAAGPTWPPKEPPGFP